MSSKLSNLQKLIYNGPKKSVNLHLMKSLWNTVKPCLYPKVDITKLKKWKLLSLWVELFNKLHTFLVLTFSHYNSQNQPEGDKHNPAIGRIERVEYNTGFIQMSKTKVVHCRQVQIWFEKLSSVFIFLIQKNFST